MKGHKTFTLLFALILILVQFVYPQTASATDTVYLRAIDCDTVLYRDSNFNDAILFLPYTYYVKLISETDTAYYVEYKNAYSPSIDGYVKKDRLLNDGLTVDLAFPSLSVNTLCTAILYEDTETLNALQYVFENREMYFLGYYTNNASKRLICVSYNDKLGYVAEETVSPFTLPNHPNELTFLKQEAPPEENFSSSPDGATTPHDTVIKITVIGCLIIAGIIALIIALNPKKPKKQGASYYDDNDFE